MPSLLVNDKGIQLAYLDSGTPVSGDSYTTVFAVHGMGYNANIFKRVLDLAGNTKLRIVAIHRRSHGGSTPLSTEEFAMSASSSDEERLAFLDARSVELANFVDLFIQKFNTPPISTDGKNGGVALLAWSAGHHAVLGALAIVEKLPQETQARFASHVRALIPHEPPSSAIGTPVPSGTWAPHFDPTIPENLRLSMHLSWITSYFKHGDITTQNTEVLSYIVPSATRRPTIYAMSAQEIAAIVEEGFDEMPAEILSLPQSLLVYRKACFDPAVRALVPRMKVRALCGDETCSFALAAFWSMQADDKANDGGFIDFQIVPGANHFIHWDDAKTAMGLYCQAIFGL